MTNRNTNVINQIIKTTKLFITRGCHTVLLTEIRDPYFVTDSMSNVNHRTHSYTHPSCLLIRPFVHLFVPLKYIVIHGTSSISVYPTLHARDSSTVNSALNLLLLQDRYTSRPPLQRSVSLVEHVSGTPSLLTSDTNTTLPLTKEGASISDLVQT